MNPQDLKYCIAFLALILLLGICGCQPGSMEQAPTTPQPAVTSTPTSTFTGSITYTFSPEDFGPFFMWYEEGFHYRNNAAYLDGDFSDDRLDGEWLTIANFDGDKRSTEKNWTWGKGEGNWLVLGGTEELPVRWDGVYTAVTDENGNSNEDITLHGVGENKGLTAKITCEFQYIGEPHSISELQCQGAMYEEE
jgi:hypothetical protein